MGHDVIARAEADPIQHGAQNRRRANDAILQQIGVREMPGTREMPAAGPVAHVLSRELGARAGVEHMCVTVELTLEGLPIDQTDGTRTADRPETASRRLALGRRHGTAAAWLTTSPTG